MGLELPVLGLEDFVEVFRVLQRALVMNLKMPEGMRRVYLVVHKEEGVGKKELVGEEKVVGKEGVLGKKKVGDKDLVGGKKKVAAKREAIGFRDVDVSEPIYDNRDRRIVLIEEEDEDGFWSRKAGW
ncbi:hypothetical protein K458DRAFT_393763 [Lentithecium fluviatile CBS 122367]|uniref:Uncharacterized protein n=1 Tax=Lentithecium fluviatile CBS 122367 TaxID=1168545 RepID=A0A6G1ING4_9PLEO|nr:hypothetical protein K458DRAFT_393763 [Lentithecium fluviatile CBS 122367]